jgi:antitoxin ParD1/3/4
MPTRNISLTEHFDRFVESSVKSGRYLNASEVVREGLRLLEEKTRQDALKLKGLREAAAAGFEAIDRGEFDVVPAEEIGATVRAIGRRAGDRARRGTK